MYYIIREGDTTEVTRFDPNETEASTFDAIPAIYTSMLNFVQQTAMFPVNISSLTNSNIRDDDQITFTPELLKAVVDYRNITMWYYAVALEACREFVVNNSQHKIEEIKIETWEEMNVVVPSEQQINPYSKFKQFVLTMQRDMLKFVVMLFELMVALDIINKDNKDSYSTSLKKLTIPDEKTEVPLVTQLFASVERVAHVKTNVKIQTGGGLRSSVYKMLDITHALNSMQNLTKPTNFLKQTDTSFLNYTSKTMPQKYAPNDNFAAKWNYFGIKPTHIMKYANSLDELTPELVYVDPSSLKKQINIHQQNITEHTKTIKQLYRSLVTQINNMSPLLDDDFSFLTKSDFSFEKKMLVPIDTLNSLITEQTQLDQDMQKIKSLYALSDFILFLENMLKMNALQMFATIDHYIKQPLIPPEFHVTSTEIKNVMQILNSIKTPQSTILQNMITIITVDKNLENTKESYDDEITSIGHQNSPSRRILNKIYLFLKNKKAYNRQKSMLDQILKFAATSDFVTMCLLAKKYKLIYIKDIQHLGQLLETQSAEKIKSISELKQLLLEQNTNFKQEHPDELVKLLVPYTSKFKTFIGLFEIDNAVYQKFTQELITQHGGSTDQDINQHTTNFKNIIQDATTLAITTEDAKHYNIPFLLSLHKQKKQAILVYMWFMFQFISNVPPEKLQHTNEILHVKYLQKCLAQISSTETAGFCTVMIKFIQRLLNVCEEANVVIVDPNKKSFLWLYVTAVLLALIQK